jgi:hypothetical protein
MPNVVAKITSRVPPEGVAKALGYADEKHKHDRYAPVRVDVGGFLHLYRGDPPLATLYRLAHGSSCIRMVFSFSEEYTNGIEKRCLDVDRTLRRVVKDSIGSISKHLFGEASEIGYAFGRHDRTDNKHFHLVVCPRTRSDRKVALVGKISPNEKKTTNHALTPRMKVLMDAAQEHSEKFLSAPEGAFPGYLSLDLLLERLVAMIKMGTVSKNIGMPLYHRMHVAIINQKMGIAKPIELMVMRREVCQFIVNHGGLVEREKPKAKATKPRRSAITIESGPVYDASDDQLDEVLARPSPVSSGGGERIAPIVHDVPRIHAPAVVQPPSEIQQQNESQEQRQAETIETPDYDVGITP